MVLNIQENVIVATQYMEVSQLMGDVQCLVTAIPHKYVEVSLV
jgi:hypothetical protein